MPQVVVVGAGPVGLISSILLSLYQIPHVLFERHPGTSIHPKAISVHQRTVEILRRIGVEKEVLEQRAPPNTVSQVAWYTNYGPDGQKLYSRPAAGGGVYADEYRKASPSPYVVLAQVRLEPILLKRAQELNPAGINFNCTVVDCIDGGDKVTLSVQHNKNQPAELEQVDTRFVIAAHGGKFFPKKLAIPWEGENNIADLISAYIRAPISLHELDPRSIITYFVNPAVGGTIESGVAYGVGPWPTDPNTEEFIFMALQSMGDAKTFDQDKMLQRIRDSLQLPDLSVQFLSLSHWVLNAVVAQQYRSKWGRVFLAGDSAHQIPPWGALGMNTGMSDALNLVWKLAFALRYEGSNIDANRLLDTYDAERRPIADRVAKTSLHNFQAHGL